MWIGLSSNWKELSISHEDSWAAPSVSCFITRVPFAKKPVIFQHRFKVCWSTSLINVVGLSNGWMQKPTTLPLLKAGLYTLRIRWLVKIQTHIRMNPGKSTECLNGRLVLFEIILLKQLSIIQDYRVITRKILVFIDVSAAPWVAADEQLRLRTQLPALISELW